MVIKPSFTPAEVAAKLRSELNKIETAIVRRLSIEGEKFVTNARSVNTYTDRTGNLRSSIGYVILKDGAQLQGFFPGGNSEAKAQGIKTANDAARKHAKGYVLIVVAGMDYAVYVENSGRDVLTGSASIAEASIQKSLKELTAKIRR